MEEQARYLKRKVRAGRIDVHPTDDAIVVHYEVEALILDDVGEPMIGERKQGEKVIRLKSLNSATNIGAMAQQIIDKCNLIHESKLPEVEQLLVFLQKRRASNKGSRKKSSGDAARARQHLMQPEKTDTPASMSELDQYLDQIYDDGAAKVEATSKILQLARNQDNLEDLICNQRLMGCLERVLREEGVKNLDVTTNIVSIFFFFSSFSQFHPLIMEHKIGSTCLKLSMLAVKQYEMWTETMSKYKRKLKSKKISVEDYETALQKFYDQEYKQDTLLYVCFHLLLNLAEDTECEIKMCNKNLTPLLTTMLDRQNNEFLLLVVTFLKKLSIFAENKDKMLEEGAIPKMLRLIPSENEALQNVTLRLLHNLSFDQTARAQMVDGGLIDVLVPLLDDRSAPTPVVVTILYHLSVEDKHKPLFSFSNCIPAVLRMLLESQDEIPVELLALAINLACNARCAQLFAEDRGLMFLFKRALATRDALLLKMLRNLSQHDEVKPAFLPFIDKLAELLNSCHDDDILVEVVGILGNIDVENFDYEKLIVEYQLLDFILDKLMPGAAKDDLILEVIILLGTVLADEKCAELVADTELVSSLIEVLKAKQKDDEIVLQIMYVFHKFVFHEGTRDLILRETLAVSYLIDLMNDNNKSIQKTCCETLDIVMEFDNEWALQIRAKKFESHNQQWIEAVLHDGQDELGGYADEGGYGDEYYEHDESLAYRDVDDENFYGYDIDVDDQGEMYDEYDEVEDPMWDY
eukprot:m.119622 g.119622  ORF g.119622 m.119622 type:complete len:749 (-) comp9559_c0_seq2:85-2331(-)